jgi:hypothetical protein
MKLLFSAAIVICVLHITDTNAQTAPGFQWKKTYGGSAGGNHTEVGWYVHQTFDGGYIVGGVNNSTDIDVHKHKGGYDGWIIKLNKNGDTSWTKDIGGSNGDAVAAIEQTNDSGYIAALQTTSNDYDVSGNHGGEDFWIVKMDKNGKIKWKKCYGGSANEEVLSIQQTSDNGYIICGGSQSNDGDLTNKNKGWEDIWILKINSTGSKMWSKDIGGSGFDEASNVKQTKDGGYIVTGFTNSQDQDIKINKGNYDYFVCKLTPAGNISWLKTYGGGNNDQAYSIVETSDGYCVAGYTLSASGDGNVKHNHYNGTADYWILKLDKAGSIKWQSSFGGSSNDIPYSISKTKDGGFFITGYTQSTDGNLKTNNRKGNDKDYWVIKISGSGKLMWGKSMGGDDDDEGAFGEQTNDCGFIVSGYASSYNTGDVKNSKGGEDWWIVKLKMDTVSYAVNIKASDTVICENTNVKFTAALDKTGLNPHYQWIKDGVAVGNDTSIYTDNTLKNGDTIYCWVTAYCYMKSSNKISIKVNPAAKPTITSSINANNVCPKDSVVLKSSIAASYLWNTGATTRSIITHTAGKFSVKITDNNGCKSTSDTIKVIYQSCAKPGQLKTSNITSTSAVLKWKPVPCAVRYNIQYKISNGTFTTITTSNTDTSYTLLNLLPGKSYQWKVASICDTVLNAISAYTTIVKFTTKASNFSINQNISTKRNNDLQVNLYPNPGKDRAMVYITNAKGNVSVGLYDMNGKYLFKSERTGDGTINLPIKDIAAGSYIVYVKDENNIKRLILIKE